MESGHLSGHCALHKRTGSTITCLHMRASTTAESRTKICLVPVKAFNPPSGFDCCPFGGGDSVVVDSLLIVTPIVEFCNCFMFCCAFICIHSSFAFISMGKRELIPLLCMPS